jgi:GH3 auxin-responsive promoter
MAILGSLIKRSISIRKQFSVTVGSNRSYQVQTLQRLMLKSKNTLFGKHYNFTKILADGNLVEDFRSTVPFHNYNQMFQRWWRFAHEGEKDIAWRGSVKYFALSSGTSESSSKHIPVTSDMIRSIKKVGMRQLFSLKNFGVSSNVYDKGILMLGGTTNLIDNGSFYEGDMSGISAKEMPKWLSYLFYKPGKHISQRKRWEDRIKLIVRMAPQWDVATICGVPAWVQIVLEEIIKYHKVKHIHDVWPNLNLYIHGGVSFEPYRESFKDLLGKKIAYVETYMASEGSFGFQARPDTEGIKLVLNAGIFFEFVPFDENNFTEDGDIKAEAKSFLINEVMPNVKYAVVISTCAGAWRYLIGDVVKFTDVAAGEIIISGRTKQFLSLCGEHLSVDNMNKAIDVVQRQLDITIKEYTVAGYKHENGFAHTWYIGVEGNYTCTNEEIKTAIDQALCVFNDDYAVERTSNQIFHDYLKHEGKVGAMIKFPRVMKGGSLDKWRTFLQQASVSM